MGKHDAVRTFDGRPLLTTTPGVVRGSQVTRLGSEYQVELDAWLSIHGIRQNAFVSGVRRDVERTVGDALFNGRRVHQATAQISSFVFNRARLDTRPETVRAFIWTKWGDAPIHQPQNAKPICVSFPETRNR